MTESTETPEIAGETVEVAVERIAAGGEGVAHADGIVVFIPRTAPGDRVRTTMRRHKRFARGGIDELTRPSRDRVAPICAHYTHDDCGGCQLQHMRYDAQLTAKGGIVSDALNRIGKRGEWPVRVEPSPEQWRYRQKLTLALRRSRETGAWTVGLHPYDDPVRVFQLEDCPITAERVLAAWREVMAAHADYPRADELRAFVQVTETDCVLVVEGGTEWPRRAEFLRAVPSVTALWWQPRHQRRQLIASRIARNGEFRPEVRSAEGRNHQEARDVSAAASFVQVNQGVARAMRDYVLERVAAIDPRTVIDGYAGVGATAIALASRGIQVTAIEVDRDASAACAKRLTPPSKAVAGRVENVLATALPADLVLLNPPRTGIDVRVAEVLQGATPAPKALVYVSCDPATLARDLARMPRYEIVSVRSFDMFPQTAHVETVCELRPAA